MTAHARGPRTVRISVLIPVFNGERYLQAALESVLAQDLGDFEVLAGDDASTDASATVLREFDDPRLQVITRRKNLGLFRNLNDLARRARGPLMRVLCQDDLLFPRTLMREVAFMALHESVGFCFSKMVCIDQHGVEFDRAALADLPEVMRPQLTLQSLFYYGCIPGNLSPVVLRRELFERAGGFDESYRVAADFDLWRRLGRCTDLGVIHDHLVKVRIHQQRLSLARTSGLCFVTENRRVRKELLPELPAAIRKQAAAYGRLRHDVLDVHVALRSLLSGHVGESWRVLEALGGSAAAAGLAGWLITLDNRLWRPKARFAA